MSAQPEKKERKARMLGYFDETGIDRKKLALFAAVYRDDTDTALKLIETSPEQINQKDPFAGLTAIHVAIYRKNISVVRALTQHLQTDMQIKDNFNRRPVDMLDYTQNQEIFEMVMDAHDPESAAELEQIHRKYVEEFGEDNDEEDDPVPSPSGLSPSNVTHLKPKST